MRLLLSIVFGALLVLSLIAWGLKTAPPRDGKTPLVWVSDNNPERQRQIKTFNELNPALRLSLDPNNMGLQKIIVQSSSGVGPDLADSYGGAQLQTLVDSGIAWDVTEPGAELGFSMKDKVWPAAWPEISYQGRQYSYPCNFSVDILIYNKNIFDRFDVPYPKPDMTWDEFIALARQVMRTGREIVYGVTGMNWRHYFASQRGQVFNEDTTRLLVRGEAMQRALQFHHDLLFKRRVMPTSLEAKAMASQGGWGAGSINMFADGRFAMYPIDKWVLIRFRGAHADQVKKGDPSRVLRLGSVPNPHLPGQPPGYGVSARSVMINSRSPHRQDALQFLKYLAGPEYSRLINEGFDALPGNPEYAMLGVQDGVPDLAELEMHQNVMYAMKYGHRDQQSPFLLDTDVDRIMWNQISRMESAPTLPIADLVATAETDLIALMQRNINRSPELRQRYRELTGTDNVAEGHRRAP